MLLQSLLGSTGVQDFLTTSDTSAASRQRGLVSFSPTSARTEKGRPTKGQPLCWLSRTEPADLAATETLNPASQFAKGCRFHREGQYTSMSPSKGFSHSNPALSTAVQRHL